MIAHDKNEGEMGKSHEVLFLWKLHDTDPTHDSTLAMHPKCLIFDLLTRVENRVAAAKEIKWSTKKSPID